MNNKTDTSIYPISNAYSGKWDVKAYFKEYSDCFDVELVNIWDGRPDCKIGHFGYNFWFRTPKGINGGMYKDWLQLCKAIKRVAKHHGLTLSKVTANNDRYHAYLN